MGAGQMHQVVPPTDDLITEVDVDGVGRVTVGTGALPEGVLSAWDPQSKILVLDRSTPGHERVVSVSSVSRLIHSADRATGARRAAPRSLI